MADCVPKGAPTRPARTVPLAPYLSSTITPYVHSMGLSLGADTIAAHLLYFFGPIIGLLENSAIFVVQNKIAYNQNLANAIVENQ